MVAVLEQCKIVCRPTPRTRGQVVCLCRVRDSFYNKKLFDYSPAVLEAISRPGARVITAVSTAELLNRFFDFLLNFLMTLSILVTLLYFLPGVLDRVKTGNLMTGKDNVITNETIQASHAAIAGAALLQPGQDWQQPMPEDKAYKVAPVYDLSLPEGRWVMNEKIGLKAPIYTNTDSANTKEVDEILDKGVYIYPQYSDIGWSGREVVLAGHHYNMNVSQTKSEQSFQNLDKLEVGDKIQIVDDYKIWTYEIYKVEESTEITEQNPDLMMYTCIYWWDAKLRLFVYGKIVDVTEAAS